MQAGTEYTREQYILKRNDPLRAMNKHIHTHARAQAR